MLVSDFFLPHLGGVETHIYSLSQALSSLGHAVAILTTADPVPPGAASRAGVRYLPRGVKVYYAPLPALTAGTSVPTFSLSFLYLRAVLLRERVTLLHAHQSTSVLANECLLYASLLALPCGHTDHSLFALGDLAGLHLSAAQGLVVNTSVQRSLAVSAVTGANVSLRNGQPLGRIRVVPNAVDGEVFRPREYLEFFDTWFMLLRGNSRQVTFLHVYHHTTIAWAWWAGMTLYSTGDSYFGALLNSWIHVMMYGYYALALMGIRCPWKKYLTMAQLAQFASVMVYTGFCFYYNHQQGQLEGRHVLACAIQVGEMASLFVLFYGFYKKSYKGKPKQDDSKKTDAAEIKDECNAALEASVSGEVSDECAVAIGSLVGAARRSARLAPNRIAAKVNKAAEATSPVAKATARPSWALFN
ncbi:hypothetical protein TeGR_g9068 [Tetraparma gracilis]|uniref:PIGA GPI anchor biosynthesis domain-containing protein n=1 Tax=Tetraparma gracilis TaxID=2962635 RepID=A0ABQ6MD04_9STRA|nr:hypothetical protein TeGR_g9068 [Tetraparma gracilis]